MGQLPVSSTEQLGFEVTPPRRLWPRGFSLAATALVVHSVFVELPESTCLRLHLLRLQCIVPRKGLHASLHPPTPDSARPVERRCLSEARVGLHWIRVVADQRAQCLSPDLPRWRFRQLFHSPCNTRLPRSSLLRIGLPNRPILLHHHMGWTVRSGRRFGVPAPPTRELWCVWTWRLLRCA